MKTENVKINKKMEGIYMWAVIALAVVMVSIMVIAGLAMIVTEKTIDESRQAKGVAIEVVEFLWDDTPLDEKTSPLAKIIYGLSEKSQTQ
jgi:hypothetical protein